jgi:hypothetical protein
MVANIFWHAIELVMVACGYLQTKLQMRLVKAAHLIAGKLHLDKHCNPMFYAGKKLEKANSQSVVYFINTVLNTLYGRAADEAVVLLCTEAVSYMLSTWPVYVS